MSPYMGGKEGLFSTLLSAPIRRRMGVRNGSWKLPCAKIQ